MVGTRQARDRCRAAVGRTIPCWVRTDTTPHRTPSTCGNWPPLDDHPDLRGHQPDPARGDGPAAAEVADLLVFPQVSSDLVDRAAAGLMSRGVDLGAARRHGVMPVISSSFPPFPDVVLNRC